MTYGLHVMKFPSGRYGYVGSIPRALGSEQPASTSDVIGGRSYRNASGELVVTEFPVFASAEDAWQAAEQHGFGRCPHSTCMCNTRKE